MARAARLASVVVVAAIVVGAVIGFFPSLVGSVKDDAAKATIVAGVLTLLGTVFTALYGEISSYHQEMTAANKAKRKLIFPLLQKHYAPWINAGNSLLQALDQALKELGETKEPKQPPVTVETAIRILYVTGLFYTVRLRFILEGGGLIILSTRREEDFVNDAYHNFENTFSWAGDQTPRKVSLLQDIFFKSDKPDDPYVLDNFREDLYGSDLTTDLQADLKQMEEWIASGGNVNLARAALAAFVGSFKESMNKLYAAWW